MKHVTPPARKRTAAPSERHASGFCRGGEGGGGQNQSVQGGRWVKTSLYKPVLTHQSQLGVKCYRETRRRVMKRPRPAGTQRIEMEEGRGREATQASKRARTALLLTE